MSLSCGVRGQNGRVQSVAPVLPDSVVRLATGLARLVLGPLPGVPLGLS